jgi:signal transduction histidine kinase
LRDCEVLLEEAEQEGDSESIADLNKINSAGQHLLKLVDEILDLSKIEAGRMDLDLEETSLADFFGEIVDIVRPAAQKNGNEIRSTIAPNLGTALCDAGKFRNMAGPASSKWPLAIFSRD